MVAWHGRWKASHFSSQLHLICGNWLGMVFGSVLLVWERTGKPHVEVGHFSAWQACQPAGSQGWPEHYTLSVGHYILYQSNNANKNSE